VNYCSKSATAELIGGTPYISSCQDILDLQYLVSYTSLYKKKVLIR